VLGSRKHCSLLQYGNNYCCKKFYSTAPWFISKHFLAINLNIRTIYNDVKIRWVFTNKLETSLIDDARVIIYDHQMFVVHATRQVYAKISMGLGRLQLVIEGSHTTKNTTSVLLSLQGC
jgi:hypothetical protein